MPTGPRAARRGRSWRILAASVLATGAATLHAALAAHAALGTPIADAELAVAGSAARAHVFADARATVIVFFRPGQARSTQALRELAHCRKSLEGRSLRWIAIVADNAPADAALALQKDTGFDAPVLVDAGDALYGSLGLALHPVVVVADADRKLAAFEPFRSVDFCPLVSARVRHVLGEISQAQMEAALAPPAEQSVDLKAGAKERMRRMQEQRK
jgi:hypothetical protein